VRRGSQLLIGFGAFLVLAGIVASVLIHQPVKPVSSRAVFTTALTTPTPSPSASPTPAPTSRAAAPPQPNAAVTGPAPPGTVTARLSVPRIGIRNAPIFDRGTDAKGNMLIAPGYSVTHYAFSAPFGTGNTVLYGHDGIQGNIFGHLYDLRAGDLIEVTVAGQLQTYRVTGHQIVAPTDVAILDATPGVRLTIITCWPFNIDTKRWIVTAIKI
jgi:sortase A